MTNKISLFEEQYKKDSTFYENNYKNDPAELDANLISFVRAKELARLIGINDIENTILKKVNDNYKYADENCRIYDTEFIKYDDVIFYLKDKLNNIDLESIISNSRSIWYLFIYFNTLNKIMNLTTLFYCKNVFIFSWLFI